MIAFRCDRCEDFDTGKPEDRIFMKGMPKKPEPSLEYDPASIDEYGIDLCGDCKESFEQWLQYNEVCEIET